jgi:asparagine synthase (glutamine-hydrolysing)
MEVVRTLGFTARFPLLDPRLVQYVARIPSSRKVTSDSANKELFHGAMKDVLPRVILERKDKLGNSVPLKNWLRDSPALRDFAQEYLSEESLRRRGLFRPAYVKRLWERHQSRRENHSHRLWSLLTFELWCRRHIDGEASPGP